MNETICTMRLRLVRIISFAFYFDVRFISLHIYTLTSKIILSSHIIYEVFGTHAALEVKIDGISCWKFESDRFSFSHFEFTHTQIKTLNVANKNISCQNEWKNGL